MKIPKGWYLLPIGTKVNQGDKWLDTDKFVVTTIRQYDNWYVRSFLCDYIRKLPTCQVKKKRKHW